MVPEPAKSMYPNSYNQPPPHVQCAHTGYMNAENATLNKQYPGMDILSTAPPDTILFAAAPTDVYKTLLIIYHTPM